MKYYVVMYCGYDPDNYFGHRIMRLEANDFEHAEQLAWQRLNKLCGKGNWEYMIAENPSSYRIYNTERQERG